LTDDNIMIIAAMLHIPLLKYAVYTETAWRYRKHRFGCQR